MVEEIRRVYAAGVTVKRYEDGTYRGVTPYRYDAGTFLARYRLEGMRIQKPRWTAIEAQVAFELARGDEDDEPEGSCAGEEVTAGELQHEARDDSIEGIVQTPEPGIVDDLLRREGTNVAILVKL